MNVSKIKMTLLAAGAVCVWTMVEPADLQAQSFDSSAAAAAEIRFQQLEKEIRRLTGQIEEQNFEIRRLKEELAKLGGDVDVRLKDLEGGSAINKSSVAQTNMPTQLDTPPPTGGVDDTAVSSAVAGQAQSLGTYTQSAQTGEARPSTDSNAAYDYAYSFIKARNFDRAEDEFAKFIKENPNSPLIANAKYWYGETFYVRGNYEKAARVFAEGYQEYPKGSKAPSNLLKLGMALNGMGKKEEACIAFRQLKNEYSRTSVPVLKRAETEMNKLGC